MLSASIDAPALAAAPTVVGLRAPLAITRQREIAAVHAAADSRLDRLRQRRMGMLARAALLFHM
jgi:hypothetical protein